MIFTEIEKDRLQSNCGMVSAFWLAVGIFWAVFGTLLVINFSPMLSITGIITLSMIPFTYLVVCLCMSIKYKRHGENVINNPTKFYDVFIKHTGTGGIILATIFCPLALAPVILAKTTIDPIFEKAVWRHKHEEPIATIKENEEPFKNEEYKEENEPTTVLKEDTDNVEETVKEEKIDEKNNLDKNITVEEQVQEAIDDEEKGKVIHIDEQGNPSEIKDLK